MSSDWKMSANSRPRGLRPISAKGAIPPRARAWWARGSSWSHGTSICARPISPPRGKLRAPFANLQAGCRRESDRTAAGIARPGPGLHQSGGFRTHAALRRLRCCETVVRRQQNRNRRQRTDRHDSGGGPRGLPRSRFAMGESASRTYPGEPASCSWDVFENFDQRPELSSTTASSPIRVFSIML